MEEQNTPATKGDILELETRVDQKIEQLRPKMNHGYRDLQERLDDSITRILNAFYGVAETHGKRLRELDGGEAAMRSRLDTV